VKQNVLTEIAEPNQKIFMKRLQKYSIFV